MDKGFALMIPKEKEETQKEKGFDYKIRFDLFGKEFSLRFKVK